MAPRSLDHEGGASRVSGMSDRVRAHERRLRVAFRRALLLALGAPAALQACGDDTVVGTSETDAGDATLAADAPGAVEGGDASTSDASGPDSLADASAPDVPSDSRPLADAEADAMDAVADAAPEGEAEAGPWCTDASAGMPRWTDAGGSCKYFVDLSCPQYPTVLQTTCLLTGTDCLQVCTLDAALFDCEYAAPACTVTGRFVAEAGQPVTVSCDLCPGAGRRPPGLRPQRTRRTVSNQAGEYFARAAHLEAASVHAFAHLRRELLAHGAPAALVAAAERSARDETVHAHAMGELALRYGTEPRTPHVRRMRVRSLEAMARDNAVEGCVRETYGALVATWQAAHARDGDVRRRFARIARDETRHAAIAWAIAEWVTPRLSATARTRVAAARRRAWRRLASAIAGEPHPLVAVEAGLPVSSQANALLQVVVALAAA
jgi:hypothetical protein